MKWRWTLVFVAVLPLWVSAQGLPPAPTVPSSSIGFSNLYCNRVNINWAVGNGNGRIVIVKKANVVGFIPTDSTYYIPQSTFGSIPSLDLSSNEFVVYNGGANNFILQGLEANTTYHVKVYEFNGSGSAYSYLKSGAPTASFTTASFEPDFSINQTRQCLNVNLFEFTGSVSTNLSNPVTYTWNFGDNKTATGTTVQHSYTTFGKRTVTMVANSLGCRDTVTRNDTVVPLPIIAPGVETDSANMDTIQCFYYEDGSQHRFSFRSGFVAQSFNFGFNNTFFEWEFGDGTKYTNRNVGRKTYSEPGVYRVRLKAELVINNARPGCIDSVAFNVVVKPRPLDSSRIAFSDTSMCLKWNLFEFRNGSLTGGTSTWTLGDGNTKIGDTVSHSYAASGRYGVRLEFIESSTARCYDWYEDTVEVVPQPYNFFTGLAADYCLGQGKVFLNPNLPGGVFSGDDVFKGDSSFNPVSLGRKVVRYIYTVGSGCLDTTEQSTWVHNVPTIDLGPDTSICEGTSYQIDLPLDSGTILWSTGATDSFHVVSGAGSVWARKSNGFCIHRDTLNVSVLKVPYFDLGPDTTLCGDGMLNLKIPQQNAVLVWEDGSNLQQRSITKTNTYYLTATNKCGTHSDTVDVEVLGKACDIQMPNAFSPNGDEINPIFRPNGLVQIVSMRIFNRWGEMILDAQGPDFYWDGTYKGSIVPEGAYFYEVIYLKPEGTERIPTAVSGPVYVFY